LNASVADSKAGIFLSPLSRNPQGRHVVAHKPLQEIVLVVQALMRQLRLHHAVLDGSTQPDMYHYTPAMLTYTADAARGGAAHGRNVGHSASSSFEDALDTDASDSDESLTGGIEGIYAGVEGRLTSGTSLYDQRAEPSRRNYEDDNARRAERRRG
jgi:hypothetical protein